MFTRNDIYIDVMTRFLKPCPAASIYKIATPVYSNGVQIRKVTNRQRRQIDAVAGPEFVGWRPFVAERHIA